MTGLHTYCEEDDSGMHVPFPVCHAPLCKCMNDYDSKDRNEGVHIVVRWEQGIDCRCKDFKDHPDIIQRAALTVSKYT